MRSIIAFAAPDTEGFLAVVGGLAGSFGWRLRTFERDDELVALAALDHDSSYEQVLWVYNTRRGSVRCLLVNRATVPAAREGAILELCARINEDLVFGCAEYSFGDRTVIFRDSVQLGSGDTGDLLTGATARVLDLGSRYAPAVRATLAGSSPVEAMSHAGDPREEPGRKESAN